MQRLAEDLKLPFFDEELTDRAVKAGDRKGSCPHSDLCVLLDLFTLSRLCVLGCGYLHVLRIVKISDRVTDFMFASHPTGSVFENNVDDKTYMKWQSVIGENYSEKDRAVVIPVTGFYFVYARFALRCYDDDEGFKTFSVQLHRLPFGYNDNVSLADSRDAIKCPSERYRTVFVGQLFELEEEDQVKVSLREDQLPQHLGVAEEGKSFFDHAAA
uniref:THD domain-containing protein n=1 Tax=Amphiprion percula TaxID=161767 RepID=A0A3P8SVW2_AMPPE